MREIRFSLGPELPDEVTNSYAGWPTALGIQPWLILQAVLSGPPDPRTGYLVNISVVDGLLRDRGVPLIRSLCAAVECRPETVLSTVTRSLAPHAPGATRWVSCHLKTTPYLTYSTE